jgi:ABC-type transporter MlaC component
MKTLSAVGLGILLLFMESVWAAAGVPGDQVRQTTDKLLAILEDPQLKGESKRVSEDNSRGALSRFDFTEMAKRSLGSEWRRRSPRSKGLSNFYRSLERAYLDKIESYNGENSI